MNQGFIGGATMPCGVAVDADPTGGVEDPGGGGGVITNPPPPVGGGGVITNPPAPVDTVAQLPTLGKIKVARRDRRLVARVPVSCPTGEAGGCRTTLRLATAKKIRRGRVRAAVVLGSKQVNLGPGQRLTVSIRLARSAAGFAKTRHARDPDPDHELRRRRQLSRAVGDAPTEDPPPMTLGVLA